MTGPFRPPTGGPAGFPGQGGQPNQPHPTVGNFGLPPAGAAPQGQPNGGGGWQMPPAPQPQGTFDGNGVQQPAQPQQQQPVQGYGAPAPQQNQPHPTAPFGQQGQPGQPGFQQPPQQNQQPQGQRVEIPDNVVLDGAGIPPELRGRTWGQVKQIYGALANDFVMRQNAPAPQQQQPQGRQPFQQQQAPVYEQGRPNGGQPPAQRQGGTFWEDPEGTIGRIVDSRLAPVTQRTTAMAIQEARNVARMSIPDFDYLEGEILQAAQGAGAEALVDPRMWTSMAELARGRMMGRGEYDPRMAQRQPQQQGQPQQQNGFARGPGVSVPAPVSPMPVGQFFTEAPTPPRFQNDGYNGGGDINQRIQALTPDQLAYAAKMQMSPADYVAWQGGVQQSAPVRRY